MESRRGNRVENDFKSRIQRFPSLFIPLAFHLPDGAFCLRPHRATCTKRETTFPLEIEGVFVTRNHAICVRLSYTLLCDSQFSEETTLFLYRSPPIPPSFASPLLYLPALYYTAILLRPLERLVCLAIMERSFMEQTQQRERMELGSE